LPKPEFEVVIVKTGLVHGHEILFNGIFVEVPQKP
jgi:hypothetical protein